MEEPERVNPELGEKACQVCANAERKYTCPGCGIHTCSLPCSKSHKQTTGCTGKRKRTELVKLNAFNEAHLMSDIRFLEEVQRETDAAVRHEPKRPRPTLPYGLKTLQREAKRRGVCLEIVSPGMQRRDRNTSWCDRRKKAFHWRIEWEFVGADLSIPDKAVHENKVLEDVLQGHVKPQRHGFKMDEKLKPYTEAGVTNLTVLMRQARCPVNAVRYSRLDLQKSLASQLSGKVIIEYPSFLVLLPHELGNYKLLNADKSSASEDEEESSSEEESCDDDQDGSS